MTNPLATPFLLEDELSLLAGISPRENLTRPHPTQPIERPDLETNPYALPILETTQYCCPGETRPISRSVHLARLAAFYPICRGCAHRHDAGHLPVDQQAWPEQTADTPAQRSLFTPEGIRGTYLNELDRRTAGKIAAALASLLWEQSPLAPRPTESDTAQPDTPQSHTARHPVVIVGHDERPHAPDLLTGIIQVLTRMSCRVINVSSVSLPCFWRSAELEKTHAGIYITGAGSHPSAIGLNILWNGAQPCTREFQLDKLEARLHHGTHRPLRSSAGYHTLLPQPDYEAELTPWFHAFRPLRIVCATSSKNQHTLLTRLFENVACQLTLLPLPVRARDLNNAADPDVQKLARTVREQQAHLGCLIDEDNQALLITDETGQPVPPSELSLLLTLDTLREHPEATITLPEDLATQHKSRIEQAGGKLHTLSTTNLFAISRTMRETDAHFAADHSHRYWHRAPKPDGHFPQSDALITLALTLRTLSRSDSDLSQIIAT